MIWSENHRKSKILPVVDLFRDFQVIQEDTRPLWKSIRPMQFFTLYNFASSTVAPRGGPDSDLERKPPKIQDFACSGPIPRFPGHPGGYSPTLEIYQTDAVFHALQTLQAAPSLPEVALTVIWSVNHRKSKILPVVDLFRDFQVTQEDTRPLWKSIRPMQFFTLYNFASSTVAPRGGPDSDLERKPPKIQDFACSGPVPRFPGHPGGYSPTLEIYQTDAVFHALQLCRQHRRSPSWP